MRINGMEGAGARPLSSGSGGPEDAYSKNLKNQIENAQKRLQELSSDTQLPPEEKMKKRQELMKEISSLQNQLRQHEIDLRKQAQEQQKEERRAENSASGKQGEKGNGGLSGKSMEAMISADNSMKQANVHGSIRTELKGRAGVLEAEIKQDGMRGLDTSAKEEELADTEQKAAEQAGAQTDILARAGSELREASGEDAENAREEKSGQKHNSDEKTAANWAGEAASQPDPSDTTAAQKAENKQAAAGGRQDDGDDRKSDEDEQEERMKIIAGAAIPAGYTPVDIRL